VDAISAPARYAVGRGIEFLQASLAYETYLETGDRSFAMRCLPSFITRFEEIENDLLRRGYVTGEGFYPDLLSAFGRTEHSSVCMELGSRYVFCQILRNLAHELGDPALAKRGEEAARSIAQKFDNLFWDAKEGFLIDAVNIAAGGRSSLHPLFSLLFLQSPWAFHWFGASQSAGDVYRFQIHDGCRSPVASI